MSVDTSENSLGYALLVALQTAGFSALHHDRHCPKSSQLQSNESYQEALEPLSQHLIAATAVVGAPSNSRRTANSLTLLPKVEYTACNQGRVPPVCCHQREA